MNSSQLTVSWDAVASQAGGSVEYYASLSPDEPERLTAGQTTLTFTMPSVLSDGSNTLYVWSRDSKNKHWSAYTKITIVIDTTGPTVASVTSMTSDGTYAAGNYKIILIVGSLLTRVGLYFL